METSQLDQPTLRIQLDRLNEDRKALVTRFKDEESKLEAARAAMEQFRGALGYNQGLIDGLSKELKDLNEQAFNSQARPLSEVRPLK